jgi:uracil-DNA glycosylase
VQDKFQLEPDDGVGLAIASLRELAKAENECTRCPLYKHATQAVPGEGRKGAHLMLVGEQPGDKEDLAGKPFVGPAGRVLDQALEAAGIPAQKSSSPMR